MEEKPTTEAKATLSIGERKQCSQPTENGNEPFRKVEDLGDSVSKKLRVWGFRSKIKTAKCPWALIIKTVLISLLEEFSLLVLNFPPLKRVKWKKEALGGSDWTCSSGPTKNSEDQLPHRIQFLGKPYLVTGLIFFCLLLTWRTSAAILKHFGIFQIPHSSTIPHLIILELIKVVHKSYYSLYNYIKDWL